MAQPRKSAEKVDQPIRIRLLEAKDRPFILSTWLRSFARAPSSPMKSMSPPLYYFEQGRLIEGLLRRAQVLVAADPDIADAILGWIVAERWTEPSDIAVVHYVYVKTDFHGRGIGRALTQPFLEAPARYFTHAPPSPPKGSVDPRELIRKHGLAFNPFLAWPR